MAINLNIQRIPLIFIFDAPESRSGKLFEGLTGGGVNAVPTIIGSVADAKSVFPALGAIGTGLAKIPGVSSATSALNNLRNKIIIPMLVNPSSLTVNKNPRVVKTLTKKGIVNQFYQAEPDVLKLSGTAGGQKSFLILSQLDSLLKTTETGTRNIVTLVYKFGGVYKGIIENFEINVNADNPNVFNYSFDFNFVDRNHFRLFLLAIRPSVLNDAIHNPKQVFKENLRLAASELINTTGISIKKS